MSREFERSECLSEGCACAAACETQPDATGDSAEVIDRRSFLTRGMLAAAAVMLAACGGSDGPFAPSSAGGLTLRVADYSSLANTGGIALVSANGSPIAVIRTGASTFTALSRICPHRGGIVAQSGSGFRCPDHGATFAISGAWTGGQHTSSLTSYPTTYDSVTGTLTIT